MKRQPKAKGRKTFKQYKETETSLGGYAIIALKVKKGTTIDKDVTKKG